MREIIYVRDPQDWVGRRCHNNSGNGVTKCLRRENHPNDTSVIIHKDLENEETVTVKFNHRGMLNGKWVTW